MLIGGTLLLPNLFNFLLVLVKGVSFSIMQSASDEKRYSTENPVCCAAYLKDFF